MKRKKRKILIFILTPFCLIFLSIFTLLNTPQIILNKFVFNKAAEYAKKFDINIEWKNLNIETKFMRVFDNRIRISFDDLCIEKLPEIEKSCFTRADIGFRYRFTTIIPSIVETGPIKIDGKNVKIKIAESEKKEKTEKASNIDIPEIVLPKFLKKSRFFPIEIKIDKADITVPDGRITGKLNISALPNETKKLQTVHIEADIRKTPGPLGLNAKIDAKSESGFIKPDAELIGKINISSAEMGNADADLQLKQNENKKIDYKTELRWSRKSMNSISKISGHLNSDLIDTSLDIDIKDNSSYLNRIYVNNCHLSLNRLRKNKNDGRLKFRCPADIYLKKIDLPDEVDPVYQPPEVLNITVISDLETFFIPDSEHNTKGKVQLKVSSRQSHLVDTGGHVTVNVNGTMKDLPQSLNLSADMDLDFIIKKFDKLAAILDNTPLSVPAPFNVLEGEIEFSLEGKVPSLQSVSHFPAVFESRLTGPGEKIFLNAKGEAQFHLKGNYLADTEVDMDVVLTDILLPLPDLQIASLPRLTPDPRIKEKPVEKKTEIPFHYKLGLKTPDDEPVKITSNLAKQAIPIHLDLKGDEHGFLGKIAIKEFTLKLFKREARIKKLEFDLKEPAETSTISAEIDIQIIEYLIKIMIEGLASKPSIWFESEPPLSEDDIISLMLYGETFDELDADLSTSIGNLRAARANKAIALTTFFLLASTPIQAVLYDPETKQFAVRFRLDNKTSIVFGTGGDETKSKGVGIRRRLGKGWLINSSVDYDTEDDTTSVSTFIEWHKRY